jgi:hypothetical protein
MDLKLNQISNLQRERRLSKLFYRNIAVALDNDSGLGAIAVGKDFVEVFTVLRQEHYCVLEDW